MYSICIGNEVEEVIRYLRDGTAVCKVSCFYETGTQRARCLDTSRTNNFLKRYTKNVECDHPSSCTRNNIPCLPENKLDPPPVEGPPVPPVERPEFCDNGELATDRARFESDINEELMQLNAKRAQCGEPALEANVWVSVVIAGR